MRYFIIILCSPVILFCQASLEQKLYQDISDYRLHDFEKIEAAFILSGDTTKADLEEHIRWFNDLVATLQNYQFDTFDRVGSAAKVFSYIHTHWLITYREKATTLVDVVNSKEFNCVAGTILYNLICEEMGWETEAFETPTHTYTIFTDFNTRVTVENTTSSGFNIMKNLRAYSQYLLQFYPEQMAAQIGLDRIYAHENSKGRQITNTELLGLLAYNRAYFAREKQNFERAYHYVQFAQLFNHDSRSNVNFEIDLYFKWGKQLFDKQKFNDAFELYADACDRYWDIGEFKKNCKAAFFNELKMEWNTKRWSSVEKMIREILDLQILETNDYAYLERILYQWGRLFSREQDKEKLNKVLILLKEINPDAPQIESLKKSE